MDELERLYRQHAAAIFRFAWGLSGNRSDAEDLLSETFVRLLAGRKRIETKTALAYLLAIARNTYLTGLRRRSREVELTQDFPHPDLDAASRHEDKERLEAALRALSALPEGERAALLLHVDHSLPYEEVAAALGISTGAAKVRVHRARVRLATAMASERSTT